MWLHYDLFTERKAHSPLLVSGERAFLSVNRLGSKQHLPAMISRYNMQDVGRQKNTAEKQADKSTQYKLIYSGWNCMLADSAR